MEGADRVALEAATARLCEVSLIDFMEEMWPAVENAPFVRNWHHDMICSHLEAVTRGEIMNLLINIPPACTKSLMVSVMWPCWEWTTNPGVRWFFASYDGRLSGRDSTKCRKLIQSERYQYYWGDRFKFVNDQNQKTYYETDAGGYRLASSIGGHATGEHMDRIVIDDPHDVESAESEAQRERVKEWWDLTMSTRGQTRSVRRVVIMQRLHEDDLSGHIMSRSGGEWDRIVLPMRFEPGRMKRTRIGGLDRRRTAGELLVPQLYSEDRVQQLERQLGMYGTAGQLQQRPAPMGGGMFKRHFFGLVDAAPRQARRVRYWDKAATQGGGAFSCGVRMSEARGIYYIEHMVRAQMEPFERNRMIRVVAEEDAATFNYGVTTVLEQEPGAGGKESSLISVQELAGFIVALDPVRTGKVERAMALASQAGAGNVKIVGKRTDEWVSTLLDEFEQFPNGKYKDQVDVCSGAFNKLALGAGIMSNMDLFGGEDDDDPLKPEDFDDMPDFFRELLTEKRQGYPDDNRVRGGMSQWLEDN